MKIEKNKKYASIAYYAFITIVLSALFVYLLINIKPIGNIISKFLEILSPVILGFVIAYLLNRPVVFIEKLISPIFMGSKLKKAARPISIGITYVLTFSIIALIAVIVGPQLAESFNALVESIPGYLSSLQSWIISVLDSLNIDASNVPALVTSWQDILLDITGKIGDIVPGVVEVSVQVISSITNFLIGIVFSIYFLSSKELFIKQLKKLVYLVMKKDRGDGFISFFDKSDSTFSKFISGKLVQSLIYALASFIVMSIIGLPYALLISVILGIFNIIPFLGPFIGGAIGAVIIFIVDPTQALWFIIMVLVLQQIDGNIIGPKILGDSIGLSAFWVLVAIIMGAGLFGITGMLLGVPVFAVIYSAVASLINDRLSKDPETKDIVFDEEIE